MLDTGGKVYRAYLDLIDRRRWLFLGGAAGLPCPVRMRLVPYLRDHEASRSGY